MGACEQGGVTCRRTYPHFQQSGELLHFFVDWLQKLQKVQFIHAKSIVSGFKDCLLGVLRDKPSVWRLAI